MAFKCIIGLHSWDESQCTKCGKTRTLLPIRSLVMIVAGADEKVKRKLYQHAKKDIKVTTIMCKNIGDFQEKINRYEKSNDLNVLINYSVLERQKELEDWNPWIERFNNYYSLEIEDNILEPIMMDVNADIWDKNSCNLTCTLDHIKSDDIIVYLTAIEYACSNSSLF